jgi:hypothetical protein
MSHTLNIKKSSQSEQLTQRSAQTITRSDKSVKGVKKDEPSVTPFRKYTSESKQDKEKIKKAISSTNHRPNSMKPVPKPTTDKAIEDELQRLINVNLNTLVSTISSKIKKEHEAYSKKIEYFLNSLNDLKLNKIEEITKSYENDIRRLEPVLDACIWK